MNELGEMNERSSIESPKLNVTQWVQITSAIVTMLAGGGLWLVHSGGPPNPEFIETRSQLNDLTKQVVQLELDHERMKYQIENLQEAIRGMK